MRGRMSGARTLYRCNDSFCSSVEKMAHFIIVHQWRKWIILSQKSADVRVDPWVYRAQRAKHQSVCQEDAAILASCRNYFMQRPTNRDIF